MHVLGLSLAFILSQDQTLRCKIDFCLRSRGARHRPRGTRGGTLLSRLPLLVLLPIPSKIALLAPGTGTSVPPGAPPLQGETGCKGKRFLRNRQTFFPQPGTFFPRTAAAAAGRAPLPESGCKGKNFHRTRKRAGSFFFGKISRRGATEGATRWGTTVTGGRGPGARGGAARGTGGLFFRNNGSHWASGDKTILFFLLQLVSNRIPPDRNSL